MTAGEAQRLAALHANTKDSWVHPVFYWRGDRKIVRGTKNTDLPCDDPPVSRYAALFDPREMFDAVRTSFLEQVLGENCVNLQDVVANAMVDDLGELMEFCCDAWGELRRTELMTGAPAWFHAAAWPIFKQCMTDKQYYLSCGEVLLVAELCKQNVVIFKRRGETAEHYGEVIHHRNCPCVWIVVQAGEGGRTRSHFQRLVRAEVTIDAMHE